MERDYKVTINMPEDIRNYFHDQWEKYSTLKWSDYISNIVNDRLRWACNECSNIETISKYNYDIKSEYKEK